MLIAKRSQKQFALQWERTGALNGHVEETFTGHTIVKIFGRQKEAIADVRRGERASSTRRASRPSSSRASSCPAMIFVGNLQYVAIAVVGGLRVATGALSLGDVQAFIQYSQQFTQPITQTASVANVLQSAVASVGAGLRAARRDRGVGRAGQAGRAQARRRPRGVRGRLLPLPAGRAPHRGPEPRGAARADGGHRRPHRRRQDHPGQPADALLRDRQGRRSSSTASTPAR